MAAFNFPNSPSTNDIHTENGVSWKWNGTVWKKIASPDTLAKANSKVQVVDAGTGGYITAETDGTQRLRVQNSGAIVTGILTSTTFVGALTGNVTGNVSGTSAGLTGTPAITVGAVTASTGQFSGNVNILGTLTYEDVKNIDSIGIVTARSGLKVTGGQLDVGSNIKAGNAGVVTATSFSGSIAASNIDSGTVATARLGSGTANNTTFLRGDQSWQVVSGTTINNNANNRVITGSASANTLEAEATLLWDGTDKLSVYDGSGYPSLKFECVTSGGSYEWARFIGGGNGLRIANTNFSANASGDELILGTSNNSRGITIASGNSSGNSGNIFFADSGSNTAGRISYEQDNDALVLYTATSERLRITSAGQAHFKETVGIQTNDVTRANLANPVGVGHSLVGMYIGDGSLLFNNTLNRTGGYYISTETNALNAGPVTLDANMKVDGAWVIV